MKFWLVNLCDLAPIEANRQDRLNRVGFLAKILSDNGHRVTWWTSTFDHYRKVHLFKRDASVSLDPRLEIKLLHGCGYRSNISLARLLDHAIVAKKFARLIRRQTEIPDIILASIPTVELCLESVRYGKANSIPVVLDMLDMWPDIFVDHAPSALRPFVRSVLAPMFKSAHVACSGATAITGITDAFVDWGLRRGNRIKSERDRAFPLGYLSSPLGDEEINEARRYWDRLGVFADSEEFVACFVGAISHQFGIGTLIEAAQRLGQTDKQIRAVICGTGDRLEHYKRMANGCRNILFPGWVNAAQIHVLLRRSSVGIDPLPDRYDFLSTINNKAIQYMSAGLPVISTPDRGVLCDLIRKYQCGFSFPHGDANGLAGLLVKLHDDPTALASASSNSAQVFERFFTAEKVYAEMMGHLVDIAQSSKAN